MHPYHFAHYFAPYDVTTDQAVPPTERSMQNRGDYMSPTATVNSVAIPSSIPSSPDPEQLMQSRSDYARKGIAKGKSLVAFSYEHGIAIVAENNSRILRKIGEVYDRIAFAGVGKYHEFNQLRVAGIRHADIKGFAFSRSDVSARSLANAYAQSLSQVFTHELKPMEVEILLAEIGAATDGSEDRLFHILYDGTMVDEGFQVVIGGETDAISERFTSSVGDKKSLPIEVGVKFAVEALSGADRELKPCNLEAAVLDRSKGQRTFRRFTDIDLAKMLDI